MTVTHAEMIACIRRELALRKNVYPGFVAKKRMSQSEADREIARMQAVHDMVSNVAALEEQLAAPIDVSDLDNPPPQVLALAHRLARWMAANGVKAIAGIAFRE